VVTCKGCGCDCGNEPCVDQPPASAPAPVPARQARLEQSEKTSAQF
jgi:hypothetical protein